MLVFEYKKRNDHKIFPWSAKLFASDSNIDKAYIPNLGGIVRGFIWGGRGWIELPRLKLVKIMLETWNFVR